MNMGFYDNLRGYYKGWSKAAKKRKKKKDPSGIKAFDFIQENAWGI